jgi:CarboxypepD_reg-like domain
MLQQPFNITLRIFACCSVLLLAGRVSAQPDTNLGNGLRIQPVYQLSGIALETGEGLPVVFTKVLVKGTRRGCFSNETGFFSLPVTTKDTLIVSRLGYTTQTLVVSDLIAQNNYPQEPFLYAALFLDVNPAELAEIKITPYRNAHEVKMAFRNIPIPTDNPTEMAADNLRPGAMANYVEGLPVDPYDELAIAQQQYLQYYATRRSLNSVNVVDSRALVSFIQYIGQRNQTQRNRIQSYWPE